MDLRKMGLGVELTDLALDRNRWQALVNAVMNLRERQPQRLLVLQRTTTHPVSKRPVSGPPGCTCPLDSIPTNRRRKSRILSVVPAAGRAEGT
jgi:hypothetical protein